MRYVVETAIDFCPLAVPAVEHRADRTPELVLDVLRERRIVLARDDRLEFLDQRLPVFRLHLGIVEEALVFLGDFQRFLEQSVIETQNNIRIHLDEAAIAVPGETRIAGSDREAFDRFVVESEIEDRVHHPRHRDRRARADRNEQWIGLVAQRLADRALDMRDRLANRIQQFGGKRTALVEIAQAFLGGDREARGHRQADAGHFGEVAALPAGHGLVLLPRVRMVRIAAEVVDRLGHQYLILLRDMDRLDHCPGVKLSAFDAAEIGDLVNSIAEAGEQLEPVGALVLILVIHRHLVEKPIDRCAQARQRGHGRGEVLLGHRNFRFWRGSIERIDQRLFGRFWRVGKPRVTPVPEPGPSFFYTDVRRRAGSRIKSGMTRVGGPMLLLEDIRRALVSRQQVGAVFGLHERLQRLHPREQANEIILAAERKHRIDEIVPDPCFALLDLEAVGNEGQQDAEHFFLTCKGN